MRRSIIAAVDGSAVATDAARVAASLAAALDRRLVLAHVAHDPPVFPYGDRWVRAAQQRRVSERAADLLDGVAVEIDQPTARRRIVFSGVVQGGVQQRLAALSREEDSDLLVLGSRPRGLLTRALLGSVPGSLANNAACPIVAVPAGASDSANRWPAGPIVCGVDGSVESTRARVVADGLADRLGLLTIPVHAAGDEPAAALTQFASRLPAALIVVGHRAGTGPLMSVAGDLAARAPVPVLVIPQAARLPHLTADAQLAIAA